VRFFGTALFRFFFKTEFKLICFSIHHSVNKVYDWLTKSGVIEGTVKKVVPLDAMEALWVRGGKTHIS
jgi:hypothetical protein